MSVTLTVFFDEPFWAGLFERRDEGEMRACKVVFGAEPSDAQVLAWVLAHYGELKFSPPVAGDAPPRMAANPKRRQRQAARLGAQGVGTHSQQALQCLREQNRHERRQHTRRQREAEAARRYELRVQKQKAKHRGR